MEDDTVALHALSTPLNNGSQIRIKGISETNMTNNAALEEGERTDTLGAINDLVGHDKVHRLNILPQRANSGEGNYASYANMSQGSNVGSVGDLVRRKLVVNAMPCEEGNVDAVVSENVNRRRWRTPRCDWVKSGDGLEALELRKTRTANDGDVDVL